MTDDLMNLYRKSAADADRVIAAIKPDQFGDPTPCDEWDVRGVLNHIVGGNKFFLSLVDGGPRPDRADDFLGDDPMASFRASVAELTEVFSEGGFAGRAVATPLGDGVGAVLIGMRTTEFLLHAWDLAVATGQPRDFDPQVVATADRLVRGRTIPRGPGSLFGPERAVPAGTSDVDALAAFTGRSVPTG